MTKPPERAIRIDYEAALEAYQQGLEEKLRGFRQGPPFLATWVPDLDPVESAVGLCEAAASAGMEEIALAFGPASAAQIDVDRLGRVLGAFGPVIVSRAEGLEVSVRIERAAGERAVVGRAVRTRARTRRKARTTAMARPEAHPAHVSAALAASAAPVHEGKLRAGGGLVLVRAKRGGATLELAVDADRIVRGAAHRAAASETARGTLDVVCRVLVGRPLQEGADHAVLRAEAILRDPSAGPPTVGIVIPEALSGDLDVASRLVRAALAAYRKKAGYDATENRFDPPPAQSWLARSEEDRFEAVRAAVAAASEAAGLAPGGAEVVRISGTRVCLALADAAPRAVRRRSLLRIEAALRRHVEATLVVELEPRPDASRIRRLV